MHSVKVSQDNPEPPILEMTSKALLNEEVIIHPTETVYGFAAVFESKTARDKILDIKKRSYNHPMSIMVNDIKQILDISGLTASTWLNEILMKLLPAPVTILLPRNKNLQSDYWDQFPKLGFRYPDHILSQKLVECTGTPLITTSANISGEPPASAVRDLSQDLKPQVSIILDGGATREKIPSTILELDLRFKAAKQVRKGALSWQQIEKRIKGS